jgi:hypothetical protein
MPTSPPQNSYQEQKRGDNTPGIIMCCGEKEQGKIIPSNMKLKGVTTTAINTLLSHHKYV